MKKLPLAAAALGIFTGLGGAPMDQAKSYRARAPEGIHSGLVT